MQWECRLEKPQHQSTLHVCRVDAEMLHAFRCEFTSICFFRLFAVPFPSSSSRRCLSIAFSFLISGGDRELPVGSRRIVRTWVMYSAPVPCFHFRAASFLLAGYTNCSISILVKLLPEAEASTVAACPLFPICIVRFEQTKCAVCTMCMFFLHLSCNDRSYNMFILMPRSPSHFTLFFFLLTINGVLSTASPQEHGRCELMGFFLWMTSCHDNRVPQWRSSTEIPAAMVRILMMGDKA